MTTLTRGAVLAVALGVGLALGGPAQAQTAEQKAAAQQAFDAAVAFMNAGDHEKACPLLEESLALDPAMGTKYQLAQCYEKTGRLASAWAHYVEVADAARAAKMDEREKWARERAEAIKPRLSHLTVRVPAEVAAVPGLHVLRDGVPMGPGLWSTPLPVDGGPHRVSATAPSRIPWSLEVPVPVEGGNVTVEVPPLAEAYMQPAPMGLEYAPVAHAAPKPVSPLVYVGLGVAGAGVVVGTVTGIVSMSQTSSLQDDCPDDLCPADKEGEVDRATALGHVSTGSFVVAGLGTAVGLIALLAPAEDEAMAPGPVEPVQSAVTVRPVLGVGAAGVRGTF